MTNLYSYCIPCDDGAAPNPFEGVCTLVICKPRIRRTAAVGDWIAGTGAIHAHIDKDQERNMSGKLIYAMKVTKKITMAQYDALTVSELQGKIPTWEDSDRSRKLGDSIYDWSNPSKPTLRKPCVHSEANMKTDLDGEYALLSTCFYYFGDQAIALPEHLLPIAQNQQGHRRQLNAPYLDAFVLWINGLGMTPGSCMGSPLYDPVVAEGSTGWGATWGACDRLVDSSSAQYLEDAVPV